MPEEHPDVRQVRTRAALIAAAVELASEREIGDITVTALAQRAGVHRSTVYDHGGSVRGVLRSAFAAELNALRETHLRGVRPNEIARALREVTLEVFAHVERNAVVYRNIERTPDSAVQSFLSEQFMRSVMLLFSQGSVAVPFATDGLPRDFVETAVARFIADGLVGLVMVWLHDGESRDPEAVLALLYELLPAWWPRPDELR